MWGCCKDLIFKSVILFLSASTMDRSGGLRGGPDVIGFCPIAAFYAFPLRLDRRKDQVCLGTFTTL
jgi:hypothetical protein